MARTIHVIGAGLAGLAARSSRERGERVVVHGDGAAGGRCRSYHDPQLDMVIDNGNHLLLSANHAALGIPATCGRTDRWSDRPVPILLYRSETPAKRWTLRVNDGRVPWWIFDSDKRVARHARARLSDNGAAPMGCRAQSRSAR